MNTRLDLLNSPPDYAGELITTRRLEESLSRERSRHARGVDDLQALRAHNEQLQAALSQELARLRAISDNLATLAGTRGLWARLRQVFGWVPGVASGTQQRRSVEALLRAQYEQSVERLTEAAHFADRLEIAEADLFDEIDRLNRTIVESAQNEEQAKAYIDALETLTVDLEAEIELAEPSSARQRTLQADLDRANRLVTQHTGLHTLYSTAEERVARLRENARQLAHTVASLRSDIAVYVAAAGDKLDTVGGQIQAVGAAADAAVVMLELRASLDGLTDSLNQASRFVAETQSYFHDNVDDMLTNLTIYDEETEALLEANKDIDDLLAGEDLAEAIAAAAARQGLVSDAETESEPATAEAVPVEVEHAND